MASGSILSQRPTQVTRINHLVAQPLTLGDLHHQAARCRRLRECGFHLELCIAQSNSIGWSVTLRRSPPLINPYYQDIQNYPNTKKYKIWIMKFIQNTAYKIKLWLFYSSVFRFCSNVFRHCWSIYITKYWFWISYSNSLHLTVYGNMV